MKLQEIHHPDPEYSVHQIPDSAGEDCRERNPDEGIFVLIKKVTDDGRNNNVGNDQEYPPVLQHAPGHAVIFIVADIKEVVDDGYCTA